MMTLVLCMACAPVLIPACLAQQNEPPKLQPVFSDDFATDTRGDYEIEGDVSWEQGRLTLSKGASITRQINGGAWAQLSLDFGEADWAAAEEIAELRIWFMMDGATNCFVRLRNSSDADPDVGSVAVVDTGEQDGEVMTQVVREIPLAEGVASRLTVEYRYGLVAVSVDRALILTAHIQNGAATVTGSRVEAVDGPGLLSNWRTASTPIPPQLTEEQQRQAAEAATANEQLVALYQQGKFAEAAPIGERVLEIRKLVLGEQHPDYANSLSNLAALYQNMGDYARAEPLYQQAMEIQKSVLESSIRTTPKA